jgi:hypothetical protein
MLYGLAMTTEFFGTIGKRSIGCYFVALMKMTSRANVNPLIHDRKNSSWQGAMSFQHALNMWTERDDIRSLWV